MKIDRKFIAAAQLKKLRHSTGTHRAFTFVERVSGLVRVAAFLEDSSDKVIAGELFRHIPTACVAALQGYFADLIARLINEGHADRSSALFKDVGFSLESLFEIKAASVTVGDVAAHAIRLNSLAEIQATMSQLLDLDFHDKIKDIPLSVIRNDNPAAPPSTLREFEGHAFKSLEEMYVLRNVLCHELAPEVKVSSSQAYSFIMWTLLYGMASEALACKIAGIA